MAKLITKKPFRVLYAILIVAGLVGFLYSRGLVQATSPLATYAIEDVVTKPLDTPIEQKVFGYSTKGKPIIGYVIGSGTNVVLLFGSIHGNEMGTADLMNKLVEKIKQDSSIVASTKKLIIIPIANPDGYYDRVDKYNANSVNLNLNFPTDSWKHYNDDGYYAGPEPFSEVESRVIKSIVEEYYPSMMLAFHARGALVSPESSTDSIALAKWYARESGYKYYTEWDYFGTATRWFTDTTGHPSVTVELTNYFKSDWEINKKALLELVSSNVALY